jgi:flagellar biosynthesis chaperone FliJ
MLAELNQLLTFRREREDRAAMALRRARTHHADLLAEMAEAEEKLARHEEERRSRQDKLYRQSMRSRLSHAQIDDLNIELDLMGEETDALMEKRRNAETRVEAAANAVEEAVAVYRKYQKEADRWRHLVDDVALKVRQERDRAEEWAVEDELSDRRVATVDGIW